MDLETFDISEREIDGKVTAYIMEMVSPLNREPFGSEIVKVIISREQQHEIYQELKSDFDQDELASEKVSHHTQIQLEVKEPPIVEIEVVKVDG